MSKYGNHHASLRSETSGAATGSGGHATAGVACRSPTHRKPSPPGAAPEDLGGYADASPPGPDATQLATGRARVLVISENEAMRQTLVDYLGEHDLGTSGVHPRMDVSRAISLFEPDLILFDEPIQEGNRFRLLRDIRSHSEVPIVLTTQRRRDAVDRIVALELGADDYLERPFDDRELLARIRAILRRCDIARNAARRPPERGGFRFAGWELYRRSRRLVAPDGEIVPLTKGEYALLIAFLSAPQRSLSREQLLQATRVHEDVFDRSIDVQVMRLRRKLEINSAAPRFIQTERGVGYAFASPVEVY